MKIYVLFDKDTKEELAFHIQNGKTLKAWRKDLESQGRKIELRYREQGASK